jgi:D-aspartate ligase
MQSATKLNTNTPALVVGLDSLPGLQTARLLASYGIPVIAVAGNPKNQSCRTRICKSIHFADIRSETLVDALLRIREKLSTDPVLVPCIDPAVLIISRNREQLAEKFRFALPRREVVELLYNKVRFYEYCQEREFPIPPTFILRERSDAIAACESLEFPGLVKPSIRLPEWDRHTSSKAFAVRDENELMACYDRCRPWTDALILQKWIEGEDSSLFSFNGYFDSAGEPLACFIARKIRQWPPYTGYSSLGIECRDDFVLEQSIRIFQSVDLHGLAYMEFKRDSKSGECYVIEPNIGRPTGRSAIAEAGGVEILKTMYCDVLGQTLPAARTQSYGQAKWIDIRHDLQSALHYWRKGELSLSEWWRSVRGRKAYAYFSWTDPMPFIYDLWQSSLKALFGTGKKNRESRNISAGSPGPSDTGI